MSNKNFVLSVALNVILVYIYLAIAVIIERTPLLNNKASFKAFWPGCLCSRTELH